MTIELPLARVLGDIWRQLGFQVDAGGASAPYGEHAPRRRSTAVHRQHLPDRVGDAVQHPQLREQLGDALFEKLGAAAW